MAGFTHLHRTQSPRLSWTLSMLALKSDNALATVRFNQGVNVLTL
jgi:hypothetical protein